MIYFYIFRYYIMKVKRERFDKLILTKGNGGIHNEETF